MVFGLVLAACMLGIVTRPAGLLAAFWPANAVLLGIFVRRPELATPLGWTAAIAAYMTADLATGSTVLKTLLLTAGNVSGVAFGYALYMSFFEEPERNLKHPSSVLRMCLVTTAAAAAAGIVGAFINPVLFHGTMLMGLTFWFVTEFVNYIAILPVILTFPALNASTFRNWRNPDRRVWLARAPPLLALIATCIASLWIGGPGALAFPVPALLWCALIIGLPGTAIVTLLFSAWTLAAISAGAIQIGANASDVHSALSIRIAVAMVALTPITVASMMAAQSEFQVLLQRFVTNDALTAALTRRAFNVRSRNLLADAAPSNSNVALLLFDINRFKQINAIFGHAVGDDVLKILSRVARAALPNADDFGRLGSTEFAVLLPDCARDEAARLAKVICEDFADKVAQLASDPALRPSVSIGVALAFRAPSTVEPLLAQADNALTKAKSAGGNRFAFVDDL